MKRKVAFKTLGCRLNQFETDSLVTDFHKAGYDIVGFSEKADVYIVNTCTVTNQGDRKSKQSINQALRNAGQHSLTVVTGCLVTNKHNDLSKIEGITYLIDNKRKSSVLPVVDAHFRGEILDLNTLPENVFNYSLVEKGFHIRSAVKIQDGCDNFCTYCIVPSVRGRAVSRPAGEILDNIRQLTDLGNKEVVITGVNISRYRYNDIQFDELIEKIIELPGDFRVRISSIEPEGFSDKLIGLFENPKLCPHLHLCLQSGSNNILLRMRRFYSVEQYLNLIAKFRTRHPDFNFTTDVIVGFPGETEADFCETLDVMKEVGFSHIHTFKYSRRTGTRADRLSDQLSEKIKSERSTIIRELSDKMKYSYRQKFLGREQTILVERNSSKGGARGYGEHYIPIVVKGKNLMRNNFYKAIPLSIMNDREMTMVAELISPI